MIVLMTVLVNKSNFKLRKCFFFNSRLLNLLLICLVLSFTSCKENLEKNKHRENTNNNLYNNSIKYDSITISMSLPPNKSTSLNMVDNYLHNFPLEFHNKSSKEAILTKKILRTHDKQIIIFYGGANVNNSIKFYRHFYFVDKDVIEIKFKYYTGDVGLMNQPINAFIADSLFYDYSNFREKVLLEENNIENNKKKLVDLFLKFEENPSFDQKINTLLNEYHFYDNLQIINTHDDRISNYLKEIDVIIAGAPLNNLIFNYVKNRVNSFNYQKLNTKNYSQKYIELLSKGVFNFLRHEDNKGDKKYQPALDWLKTTDLYKKDSIYIKKEVTPISNEIFKKYSQDLTLTNTKKVNIDLKQIIIENPSNYYLIDFWATWCAPCIQGVKTMKKMELPNNVKVISISVDKEKDKQKWIKMTNKLEQSITYWLDDTNDNTKEFVKFIEMQTIPRYILIDKNMNLIDQAFYHPHEPQFLSKLQDVKNHKYW